MATGKPIRVNVIIMTSDFNYQNFRMNQSMIT